MAGKKSIEDEPRYFAQTPPLTDPNNWIDTGSHTLNAALGVGIPIGRVTEIYGPSQSRKSTLGCFIFAGARKVKNLRPCWYSSEEGLPEEVGGLVGMDFVGLRYKHVPTIEQLFNRAGRFCRKAAEDGVRPLWLIDSLSALSTNSEIYAKGGVDKVFHFNPHARKIAQGWRTHFGTLVKHNGTALVISHEKPTGVPGGVATGFFSSVRIMIRPRKLSDAGELGEIMNEDGVPIGFHADIHVVKNRFGPKISVPWRFYYDRDPPVDPMTDMWDFINTYGILNTAGSYRNLKPYDGKSFYAKDFKEYHASKPQDFWDTIVREFYKARFDRIYKLRGITPEAHERMYNEHMAKLREQQSDELDELVAPEVPPEMDPRLASNYTPSEG